MKIKIFTFLVLLSSILGFSQNVGDFRTNTSATPWPKDWTTLAAWEYWNGTAWVSAAGYHYPGQTSGDANAIVTIQTGTSIGNNLAPTTLIFKELKIQGTLTLLKSLDLPMTNNFFIDKGLVLFDKSTQISLPAGANFSMNIDNTTTQGLQPKDGNPDCNGNTALVIGGEYYTACEGGGSGHVIVGDFDDLNTTAVYFKANPATNPNSSYVCNGTNVQLLGGYIYSGNLNPAPTSSSVTYLWELVSAPAGYSFNSSTSMNPSAGVLNISGVYRFRLTVSYSGRNSFKEIDIEVDKNTTFTSSGWSNGSPNINMNATINTNYSTATNGSFEACNCIVNSGVNLVVNANTYVKVQNNITNLGSFLVESDANLLQVNPNGVNSGNISVFRNAQLKRLDYNYWGAPVSGQNFKSFSPQTVESRFYNYLKAENSFSSVPNLYSNFVAGKGYAIRAPNNYTTTVQNFVGKFIGVPNNGDVSVPVAYSGSSYGRNLVSNPYPSNLDLRLLHQNNPSLSGGIFYFWTNDANSWLSDFNTANGIYGTYSKNQYAVLNLLGSTPASTPADLSPKYPSAIIKPGQGFIMQVSAAGNLKFQNSMRTAATTDGTNTSVFINRLGGNNHKMSNISGRYWLSLISPAGAKNVILVGYVNDAVNKLDAKYDAEIMSNASDNIYSIVDNKYLAIQGRASSSLLDDVVPIGVSHYMPGNYEINIENKDGVFGDAQEIFLRDKELNVINDITKSPYSYTVSSAGVNDNRFEIIYRNTSTLSTDNANKPKEVLVYKNNDYFTIEAYDKITEVLLYDATGKLIGSRSPNSNKTEISTLQLPKGVYLLKIKTKEKILTQKIVN